MRNLPSVIYFVNASRIRIVRKGKIKLGGKLLSLALGISAANHIHTRLEKERSIPARFPSADIVDSLIEMRVFAQVEGNVFKLSGHHYKIIVFGTVFSLSFGHHLLIVN